MQLPKVSIANQHACFRKNVFIVPEFIMISKACVLIQAKQLTEVDKHLGLIVISNKVNFLQMCVTFTEEFIRIS